jgi:hypothetical protein
VALVVVGVLSITAVEVTGQPGFCNSCHIMNAYYGSWTQSKHAEVNCLDCHLQPGFTGYVKGKINGLAQLVDCVVGRVGTKPSATIVDGSCLNRLPCPRLPPRRSAPASLPHDKHIDKVDG